MIGNVLKHSGPYGRRNLLLGFRVFDLGFGIYRAALDGGNLAPVRTHHTVGFLGVGEMRSCKISSVYNITRFRDSRDVLKMASPKP